MKLILGEFSLKWPQNGIFRTITYDRYIPIHSYICAVTQCRIRGRIIMFTAPKDNGILVILFRFVEFV